MRRADGKGHETTLFLGLFFLRDGIQVSGQRLVTSKVKSFAPSGLTCAGDRTRWMI